jgi:hypothetical protein
MCWRDRATRRAVSGAACARRLLFKNPEKFLF